MAIRYAVASGNWSSTSTWDGGTTLPGSGDDVYANGFTVSIDQSISVASLKKIANVSPSISTGGTFNVTASVTITLTSGIVAADNAANSTSVLNIASGTPTVIINANIAGGSSGSRRGLGITVNATVTVNGNVVGGSAAGAHGIHVTAASAVVTVNGTVTGGTGGLNAYGVNNQSTARITVVGTVVGGNLNDYGVFLTNGVVRLDAELLYSATGCSPVQSGTNKPVFVRGGSLLKVTAPSDDNWPLATGATISLTEGGGADQRYTLAVGDSAVTPG